MILGFILVLIYDAYTLFGGTKGGEGVTVCVCYILETIDY